MSKLMFRICIAAVITVLLAIGVCATYPSSGKQIPEGSVLIKGSIIGEKTGWDGSAQSGCKVAFDGDIYSFYDPTIGANTDCYAGMKLNEQYVLTMVCIMPRETYPDRFDGAMIQGSNDGENWTTLWQSNSGLDYSDWQVIKKFKNNIGYSYYRYCNDRSHGDVAEVEFYGYAGTSDGLTTVESTVIENVTVSFDTCGGEDEFEPIEVKFGDNYPELSYTPTKEGYVFVGWYTAPEDGIEINTGKTVTEPSSHVLYAHWIEENKALLTAETGDTDNMTESGVQYSEIQGICMTLSVIFVLAAAVALIVKKRT